MRCNILREFVYVDVRLVGSGYPHQGRLEVNVGGIWGTVCDDYFDYRDAAVACSMLGYGYVSKCAVKRYFFYSEFKIIGHLITSGADLA